MKNDFNNLTKTLAVVFSLVVSTSVMAATYTTIADGSWDDMTSVWSLDGTDACGCAPSATTSGDDIIIRHDISTTANITVSNGSQFVVENSGNLSGSHTLTVYDGVATFNGDVSITKCIVSLGAQLNVINSILYLSNRLKIDGSVLVDGGYVAMSNGNIDIMATGSVKTLNSGKLDAFGGNIENFGTVDICPTCCMTTKGNWKNHGTVEGSGAATTITGNMQNDGTWSMDVTWCSAGFDTGMPSAEDCGDAEFVCGQVSLPVELSKFDVANLDGCIYISWQTETEHNTDKFIVMRSIDGRDWSSVGIVKAAGTSTETITYSMFDYDSKFDIAFYRLKQVDRDGEFYYSHIRTVVGNVSEGLTVYPNPIREGSTEPLMVNLPRAAEVSVMSADGATVLCPVTAIDSIALDLSNFRSGVYMIQVQYLNGGSDTRRVMIADY